MITRGQSLCKAPIFHVPSTFLEYSSSSFLKNSRNPFKISRNLKYCYQIKKWNGKREENVVCEAFMAVDPWAPAIDSESIASQLFAFSLFPYLGFLYFITKSRSTPKLTLFGFYFLLAFVGATIPAGIYAKVNYGTSLANLDWLHGGAESLLTLTNLFIVLGLRQALRESRSQSESDDDEQSTSKPVTEFKEDKS